MDANSLERREVATLLDKGNAHMSFAEAVRDFPITGINTIFPNGTYTAWHLLEHMRITQHDILDFIQAPVYHELAWPGEYWPAPDRQATEAKWRATIESWIADNRALQAIVLNPDIDLTTVVPHGTGQTILREMLVVADHNAYHLGEFAIMRQVMGTWPVSS